MKFAIWGTALALSSGGLALAASSPAAAHVTYLTTVPAPGSVYAGQPMDFVAGGSGICTVLVTGLKSPASATGALPLTVSRACRSPRGRTP